MLSAQSNINIDLIPANIIIFEYLESTFIPISLNKKAQEEEKRSSFSFKVSEELENAFLRVIDTSKEENYSYNVYNAANKISSYSTTFSKINETKILLIYEEVNENKLDLFGDNIIALQFDIDGIITYASSALSLISGYSNHEIIGQAYDFLRHRDASSRVYDEMKTSMQEGKGWQGEIKKSRKNGEHYWVKVTLVPEFDNDNKLTGYTSLQEDISTQKAKDEFMSNMSHELRTPLNAIIGFSSILNKIQTDAGHKNLSKQINDSSNSLLTLINDILDLAKIQDANFSIEHHNFNAYDEIVVFSQQFELLAYSKELVYKTSIKPSLKAVFNGDLLRLKQVALNLISNAVKFTPKGGEVSFIQDYVDGILITVVEDSGIGMSPEVADKIFKPFKQADGTTTRKYGGTGLGLSITQNLVELMNGKIEIESNEGIGTKFTVSIPLEKLEQVDVKEVKVCIDTLEKENTLHGHILIAEDNKTNQLLIRMIIENFGLTCDMANDGKEVISMYNPQKHKLILMDENMPNMNGIEAMQIIKKKYMNECGAIIALTANAMAGDKEKFLDAGMNAYVAKPLNEDDLYNTLLKFLS